MRSNLTCMYLMHDKVNVGNKTTFSEQLRGLDCRVHSGLQVAVILPLDLSPNKMRY